MKCMIVVSCLVALAAATPGYLNAGLGYAAPAAYGYAGPAAYGYASPLAYSTVAVAPGAVTSQHHEQDTLGQYSYGYQGDTSAKEEVRTADGITQGAYSYLDANGLVQSTSYVSDPINGFRVAATNLPVGPAAPAAVVAHAAPVAVTDTVEVAAARAAHFNAHVAAKAQLLGRKKRSPGYLNAGLAAPIAYAAAPAATFGYSSVSAHPASFAVAHAAPVAYAAAPIALAPSVSIVDPVAVAAGAPLPVADTVEVAAARAAHFNAHAVAKAHLLGRKKRSPGFLNAAPVAYAAAPAFTYAAAPAVAYAATPAVAYAAPAYGYSTAVSHAVAKAHLFG